MGSSGNNWKKSSEEALYTFTNLQILQHLPNQKRSLEFLEKLRDDAGIKKVMCKYKWTVGVLQEMEPLGNTERFTKTLGRNQNKGEVIQIRLRTDSYDGWRDYKTVRKTLCHELAHNVHTEHDRQFWDLTNKLEKEVEAADWTTGGRPLTDQVFYNPPEREQQKKPTGVNGGTHRLGGGGTGVGKGLDAEQRNMREILAKAAEERMKRLAGGS